MTSRSLKVLTLAFVLLALPVAASAQDKAKLPYSTVSEYQALFQSLEHLDRIVPSMIITSTNPDVPPQSIEFKIIDSGSWHTFNPDEYGEIEFPIRPDWADSTLLSDQPKGTLQLAVGYSARPLTKTSMTYQELMGLVSQFEEALTALAKMRGQKPPTVKGLTIQLPEGSNAALHVLSQKRKQTIKPYTTGVVVIKLKDALWKENPAVEFDDLPIGIVPLQ
ncbi:MAG: hypothetical protein HKN57_11280 [Xanthomonadales bacterium]|nr:hypothetical protein [Gammaproteobacteria bacterium]MBT8052927.1 hypothetical protein [Gammaproteobacteria bacterium]NND57819.1 hypothetical protein [Xanthomonadales bacterium]NNK50698.1 hypothetical protein [Xanthomonadales bacterium]